LIGQETAMGVAQGQDTAGHDLNPFGSKSYLCSMLAEERIMSCVTPIAGLIWRFDEARCFVFQYFCVFMDCSSN
jgi:hypothetical protein